MTGLPDALPEPLATWVAAGVRGGWYVIDPASDRDGEGNRGMDVSGGRGIGLNSAQQARLAQFENQASVTEQETGELWSMKIYGNQAEQLRVDAVLARARSEREKRQRRERLRESVWDRGGSS